MTGNRHVRFWSRAGRGDPPGLGSGRVGNHRLYPACSGREGPNLAGESPAVSMARFRHVAIPPFVLGHHTFFAWRIRPGCPEDLELLREEPPGGLASGGACTSRNDGSPDMGSSGKRLEWRQSQRAELLACRVRPLFVGKKRAVAPRKRGGVQVQAPPHRWGRSLREGPPPSRGTRQPAKTRGPSHRA